MTVAKKDQIRALLKSIETGDVAAVAVVNEERYVQHNPHTQEGSEGLAQLFTRLSKTSPRVEIVRAFEDGEFVFAHTEYDFADENVGFELFRFEHGRAVEHWDNIQSRMGPNPAGHTMTDGPTEATDIELTEANRRTITAFAEEVLVGRRLDMLADFVDPTNYTEHTPHVTHGFATAAPQRRYDTVHRVLAEGDFALTVSEGVVTEVHSSFYDLYRLADGRVVEHWDTVDVVPPRSEWNNDNGKF